MIHGSGHEARPAAVPVPVRAQHGQRDLPRQFPPGGDPARGRSDGRRRGPSRRRGRCTVADRRRLRRLRERGPGGARRGTGAGHPRRLPRRPAQPGVEQQDPQDRLAGISPHGGHRAPAAGAGAGRAVDPRRRLRPRGARVGGARDPGRLRRQDRGPGVGPGGSAGDRSPHRPGGGQRSAAAGTARVGEDLRRARRQERHGTRGDRGRDRTRLAPGGDRDDLRDGRRGRAPVDPDPARGRRARGGVHAGHDQLPRQPPQRRGLPARAHRVGEGRSRVRDRGPRPGAGHAGRRAGDRGGGTGGGHRGVGRESPGFRFTWPTCST